MKSVLNILLFTFLLVASGCDAPHVEKPENLIDSNKMVDILADIHLAETTFNNLRYQDSAVENSSSADFYYSILHKYQVADTVFEKSLVFYASQPRRFEKMYRQAMNKLSELEQEYSGRNNDLQELELQNKR